MSSGAGARGNPSKSEVPMWMGGGGLRLGKWALPSGKYM